MPPAHDNVRGFFENLDFVQFHERWLKLFGHDGAGWLASRSLELPAEAAAEAEDLIVANASQTAWGWKDPRTTLFLDFWSRIVPNAYYVIVYREPTEVIESLYRRGDAAVNALPELAARAWISHNAAALRFARVNRDRCLLANVSVIARDSERFLKMVNARFGFALEAGVSSPYDADLMNVLDAGSLKATLLRYLLPELGGLFVDLETEADLAAGVHRDGGVTARRARDVFFDGWRASCRPPMTVSSNEKATADVNLPDVTATLAQARQSLRHYRTALSDFSEKIRGEEL